MGMIGGGSGNPFNGVKERTVENPEGDLVGAITGNPIDTSPTLIERWAGDVKDAVTEGASTGWDIISGNRDARRNRAEAEKNRKWQEYMSNTEVQRRAKDLEAAGINPVMAGSMMAGTPSGSTAHSSNSAGALSGFINNATSIFSNIIGLKKAMAEIPQMEANTRKTLADANYVEASTPGNLRNLDFTGAFTQANTGKVLQDTMTGKATEDNVKQRTATEAIRTHQERLRLPQFHAEADWYRKHGSGGVTAEKIKGPVQAMGLSSSIVGSMVDKALSTRSALNTAVDALASRAADRVLDFVRTPKKGSVRPRKR